MAAYLFTILPFDDELVLQHDKVTFPCLVLHEGFKARTEGV